MVIKKPFRLNGFELGLFAIIGIVGGVYIWRPLIIDHNNKNKKKKNLRHERVPKWASKQRGKLVYLGLGIVGFVFTGYLAYSKLYPFYRRRKMRLNEAYANTIYEYEQKRES